MSVDNVIRMATQEDLPAVLVLMHQLNPSDAEADPRQSIRVWDSILSDEMIRYIVAECDGCVVGACCFVIVPNLTRGNRPFGVIENVIVDQAHRRHGVASQMLSFIKNLAISKRCYKLMLMSNNERKEAHQLYEAMGFEKVSKTAFDLRLPVARS